MFQVSQVKNINEAKKLFLGFDINKNSTGFSILNENSELLYSEVFTAGKKYSFEDLKLNVIYYDYFKNISDELGHLKNEIPIYVAIEKPFAAPGRMELSSVMFRIVGYCLLVFYQYWCMSDIKQIAPTTIKAFAAGHGHAPKEKVIECVEDIYNLKDEKVQLVDNLSEPNFSSAKSYRTDRADSIGAAMTLAISWKIMNDETYDKENDDNYSKRYSIAKKLHIKE